LRERADHRVPSSLALTVCSGPIRSGRCQLPSALFLGGAGGHHNGIDWLEPLQSPGAPAMPDEPITAVISATRTPE